MQVSATADAKFADAFWAFTPTSLDCSVYAGAALQITIQIPANTKAGITAQISYTKKVQRVKLTELERARGYWPLEQV